MHFIGSRFRLEFRGVCLLARSKEGSGQFRVKMHAKLQVAICQSIRDAKILWFRVGSSIHTLGGHTAKFQYHW